MSKIEVAILFVTASFVSKGMAMYSRLTAALLHSGKQKLPRCDEDYKCCNLMGLSPERLGLI